MNILITSIIDLEKTSYSRLHRYIEHLLKKGHSITVISIRDTWKHKGVKQNQDLVKRIRIIYMPATSVLKQKLWAVFNSKKLISKIDLSKIDVHLAYNSFILSYYVSKQLRKRGVATVYDLADDLPEMVATSPQIPKPLRPFAGWFSGLMLRRNLRNAKAVAISAKEFLKSMDIRKYNYEYIPNGVDLKRFRCRKDRKQKSRAQKSIVVGYLGALREWVDLRPMLLAAKSLKSKGYRVEVLVVGGEEDLPQYRTFVSENNITNVRFTGNVPYDEVPSYINQMDITTVPFRKNPVTDGTCPLKLLEYIACEKPAISSRLNEVRSMLGDLVLYADTPEEWEKQIAALYHDPILRDKMGKDGRKFVEDNFNWDRICRDMESLLEKNLGKK